jgi:hypothetical protein
MSKGPEAPAPPRRGISPRSLLVAAATIAIAFGLSHLAGLRDYAGFLSGSAPAGMRGGDLPASLGVLYVILYFLCVVVAPILALGAGILAALIRAAER